MRMIHPYRFTELSKNISETHFFVVARVPSKEY